MCLVRTHCTLQGEGVFQTRLKFICYWISCIQNIHLLVYYPRTDFHPLSANMPMNTITVVTWSHDQCQSRDSVPAQVLLSWARSGHWHKRARSIKLSAIVNGEAQAILHRASTDKGKVCLHLWGCSKATCSRADGWPTWRSKRQVKIN